MKLTTKFDKLKKKFDDKILVKYGSTLIINKYSFTLNEYGDKTLSVNPTSSIEVDAIPIAGYDDAMRTIPDIKFHEGEVLLYISSDNDIIDTETEHYEFRFRDKDYVLLSTQEIGNLADVEYAVLKQVILKPKFK